MSLTASQVRQLVKFVEEQDHDKSILLREAPNLGGGYVELVVLDANGEPTAVKRVLFPA
jgi:hypothetical protein